MGPDDEVCLCFHVSLRKIRNHLERERPAVASQLSECLGAGTGCGWCVPRLRRLHAQALAGTLPQLDDDPDEYARGRSAHRSRTRPANYDQTPAPGGTTMPEATEGTPSPPVRVPLTQLRRGQRAIVDCSNLADLPEGERCLLHAMGMHDECQLRVCSPGAPCIVQIDDTRLGISADVARRIMVTPIEDGDRRAP
jgi:bacterioferritin-associated ferredoxin/Fe2+ transport system protein FeoA